MKMRVNTGGASGKAFLYLARRTIKSSAADLIPAMLMVCWSRNSASAEVSGNSVANPVIIAAPKDPDWAKYVLLAVIWAFVIAAVIGPVHRLIQRKRLPPDIIKSRGW